MSNRLEQEFPAVRWQTVRARAPGRELVRGYVERGRQLRSEAIRRTGRAGLAALARTVHRALTLIRCTALSLGGRGSAADCFGRSTRRA